MRISLIHGEDNEKAYANFREVVESSREKGFEVIGIDDIHKISSQFLFEDKVVFVLEKPGKVKLSDWKWFSKVTSKYNSNLIIYVEGNASAVITKSLPKDAKVQKFELPKTIFAFLDSFYPGNAKKCLMLLDDLVKNEPIELVFYLLARQLRDLYWASVSKESMPIPDWRILKLGSQAKKFSDENLKEIINELSEIDIRIKTSSEDLRSSLDFLIVKHLE